MKSQFILLGLKRFLQFLQGTAKTEYAIDDLEEAVSALESKWETLCAAYLPAPARVRESIGDADLRISELSGDSPL